MAGFNRMPEEYRDKIGTGQYQSNWAIFRNEKLGNLADILQSIHVDLENLAVNIDEMGIRHVGPKDKRTLNRLMVDYTKTFHAIVLMTEGELWVRDKKGYDKKMINESKRIIRTPLGKLNVFDLLEFGEKYVKSLQMKGYFPNAITTTEESGLSRAMRE